MPPLLVLYGDLVFPFGQTSSLGPPGVWYGVGSGGEFPPSFSAWSGRSLQGVLTPGLGTPAFPTGMQLGTFVLPFRFKHPPWDPQGSHMRWGLAVNFFLPCAPLGMFIYRECHPPGLSLLPPSSGHNQGLLSEHLWSDILPGTLRGCVSIWAGGKFSPLCAW